LLEQASSALRLDKWLWYARFFKTRSLATKLISSGKLRINGEVTSKPHRHVQIGQVLTFAQGAHIRVIRVEQLASRRGPAPEAELLYTDLDPPQKQNTDAASSAQPDFEHRQTGSGRPTKRDRRQTARLKDPFS